MSKSLKAAQKIANRLQQPIIISKPGHERDKFRCACGSESFEVVPPTRATCQQCGENRWDELHAWATERTLVVVPEAEA